MPPSATAGLPLRRLLAFAAVFMALHTAWSAARGSALERWVIDGATVHAASAAINLLTPQVQAAPAGPRIRAAGGGLNILNGCEGTEVLFLLAAAVLVAPRTTWRQRAAGLAAGTLFVFVLNQARVLALFYALRADRELFAQLHGFVAPLLLVAATLIGFVAWLGWCRRAAQPA